MAEIGSHLAYYNGGHAVFANAEECSKIKNPHAVEPYFYTYNYWKHPVGTVDEDHNALLTVEYWCKSVHEVVFGYIKTVSDSMRGGQHKPLGHKIGKFGDCISCCFLFIIKIDSFFKNF